MLSEREQRQFEEIVRALRDDSEPEAAEPLPRAASVFEVPVSVGRWRRVVAWAERRFDQRLDRQEFGFSRSGRDKPWRT